MRPKRYKITSHDIDPSKIDSDALYVLRRLHEAGFEAYLVGGSVRDLLIKQSPKDYDISTSAQPEEIKRLFQRNCILIGRRFRLAHVRFGHKVIEVATFRSGDNDSDLIIRDNQWGTAEEDVIRRDFTINGLFYDPVEETIIDYVGGWEDIHHSLLRSIGDPEIRFKQDPVRMIRLLKFRARFGFNIDPKAKEALIKCQSEILKSSPARILEELFRMLESGASARFFLLLQDFNMLNLLIPSLSYFLKSEEGQEVYRLLACADQVNINSKKTLDRAVLCSCLLFPLLQKEVALHQEKKESKLNVGDIIMLTSSLIKGVISTSFSHFPRRISTMMNFILSSQYRLTPLSGKKEYRIKLLKNKEFIYALDLLKIRALANKDYVEHYSDWNNHYRRHKHSNETKKHHHPPPEKEPLHK